MREEKVLDGGLAVARLGGLAGGDDMGDEAGCRRRVGEGGADGGVEGVGEEGEVERGDVGVGDEDVGGGGDVGEDGVCDVVVEAESAVDRVSAEDGDRVHGAGDLSLHPPGICTEPGIPLLIRVNLPVHSAPR